MKNKPVAYLIADGSDLDVRPIAVSRSRIKIKVVGLKRGEVVRLGKNSGAKNIETQNGVIWLTGTPASGDILLQSGGQFEFENHWPYVIEALEDAELSLYFI